MEEKIFEIIRESESDGCTITDVVRVSKLPRSVVRILLARLEGAQRVSFREVGMSKIYKVVE